MQLENNIAKNRQTKYRKYVIIDQGKEFDRKTRLVQTAHANEGTSQATDRKQVRTCQTASGSEREISSELAV